MLVITIITYSLPSTIAGVWGWLQILKIINCEYFICDLAQRDSNKCGIRIKTWNQVIIITRGGATPRRGELL